MWEQLRRETRAIESAIEEKLSLYSSLNSTINLSRDHEDLENPSPDNNENAMRTEIEKLLGSLSENIERMSSIASTSSNAAHSALLQSSIQQKRESARLFKRSTERISGEDSQMEYLLRERNAIDSSSRIADSVIGQAMETKSSLDKQRDRLAHSHGRVAGLSDAFAGINGIVDRIRRKRLRNNTILALVIAACICFIILFKF